jgi:transcriptional regulator with XRE-family HTH domain
METVTIGRRIRLAREAAHLTQSDLADLVGVAANSICRYERGDVGLSVERATHIAEVLGMTLSQLVGETEAA